MMVEARLEMGMLRMLVQYHRVLMRSMLKVWRGS